MATLTFSQARETVIRTVSGVPPPAAETVDLLAAQHRVLAQDVVSDRDQPALARSVRDGFAVRADDLPGELEIIGEVRAGERFQGRVEAGQALEIMTGAPMPEGADAVVMVEHVTVHGGRVRIEQDAEPGLNINPKAAEAVAGETVMRSGKRLDYTNVALLASVGLSRVRVYAKPVVAILSTGDEVVDVPAAPLDYQVRNSNAYALAAQVARAGGRPRILPVARDTMEHTRHSIEQALQSDLLLLSGGVSVGKYDLVERVLAEMGAEFFFDRVKIQPGQPAVFGRVRERFFFGLPGNPSSTMITFETLARAALELIGGQSEVVLLLPLARLTEPFRHRSGLTRFLPAMLSADGGEVTPVKWHGSGDMPTLSWTNAFLVADPDKPEYSAGEWIRVLMK